MAARATGAGGPVLRLEVRALAELIELMPKKAVQKCEVTH